MKILPDTLPDSPDELLQILQEREVFWQEQVAQWQEESSRWQAQYQSMVEQLLLARHKRFAASSEEYPGQGALFNEAEQTDDLATQEPPQSEDDAPHAEANPVTPERKSRRPRLPAGLPRVEVIHDLPEEEKTCTCCGHALHRMGEECSEQLEFIPASIKVIRHIRPKYSCRQCERQGTEVNILVVPVPPTLLPRSIATPSLLAQIISSKFQFSIPLYRQEQWFAQLDIELSRQTMSSWMLKCAEKLLPLYKLLHQHLLTREVIWSDDTTLKVVEVQDKKKCYMWVYGCGSDSPEPGHQPAIVLYDYQDGHGAAGPVGFTNGYEGYLQADGYAGYTKTGATVVGCMAHARRKFMEAKVAQPKGKVGRADWALNHIQKLYRLERELKGQPTDVIAARRQQDAIPLLDEFKAWLDKTKPQVPEKNLLGKAVDYSLNQWSKLVRYVEHGQLSIDNNRAERAIKPFVIGRKNWMLSNTRSGARSSAILYSLVETAKANGLVPFDYLMYLFSELPHLAPDGDLASLLPWNVTLTA
jgi:transposase